MAASGFFMPNIQDLKQLKRTFKLALRGRGQVSPNPRVGAVIVGKDGEVISEGFHRHFGAPHAEVDAIDSAHRKTLDDATLYVNLEPCVHHGKTPPCCEAIVRSGIRRVVAATIDPDPRVNGKGIKFLREAGVEVAVGLLENEARYLNRGYLSATVRKRAWCAVKVALSLDGKMAAWDGTSKWITGSEARQLAHTMRADHDAVLVGAGTVRYDDPELTVRMVKGPNPARIILAPKSGLSPKSKLAIEADKIRTILVCGGQDSSLSKGSEAVELLALPLDKQGDVKPKTLLEHLPALGICSVLIEGGSGVLSSFMQAGVIDEISVALAPSVIGHGLSPFEGYSSTSCESRPVYLPGKVRRFGSDIVVTYLKEKDPFLPD
jgi:diaminohydroxyphosphoribosylaminopyrimidine deaminase/5-amino-6-(5-phosphoribosylamino)uracil reductase